MIYAEKRTGRLYFDFQVGGNRFTGLVPEQFQASQDVHDNLATRKKQAARWEKSIKEDERTKHRFAQITDASRRDTNGKIRDMTLDQLAGAYWTQVGKFTEKSASLKKKIAWLSSEIGRETPVSQITDEVVNSCVVRRSNMNDARIKSGSNTNPRKVSKSEVNRSVTQLLRTLLNYGRDNLKLQLPDMPNWKRHIFKEPLKIHSITYDQDRAIRNTFRDDFIDVIDFALHTGLRRREVAGLVWSSVDFVSKKIRVREKGNRLHVVQMTKAIESILRRQCDPTTNKPHHEVQVFTFVARRTVQRNPRSGISYTKGQRYPLNYQTLGTEWNRWRLKTASTTSQSGLPVCIKDVRIHDLRHTFVTRIANSPNGGILVAQKAVGHSDIKTTARYAHADSLRILEAMSAVESATLEVLGKPQ